MPVPRKIVCLSYPQIDFYFSEEKVPSAFFCSEKDFSGDKIRLASQDFFACEMPFIDFDFFARFFSGGIESLPGRTALIFKKKCLEEAEIFSEDFALVTSGDCKIVEKDLKDFSLFSDFYSACFVSKGILAWSFVLEKPAFLIDLGNLLKTKVTVFSSEK